MITATLCTISTFTMSGDTNGPQFKRGVPVPVGEQVASYLEATMPGYFVIDRNATPESLNPPAAQSSAPNPAPALDTPTVPSPVPLGPELAVSI